MPARLRNKLFHTRQIDMETASPAQKERVEAAMHASAAHQDGVRTAANKRTRVLDRSNISPRINGLTRHTLRTIGLFKYRFAEVESSEKTKALVEKHKA